MKNSKKEIYAAYGIEFKNGRILAPVFGWIAPLLVNGNAKLGEGIFTWSMLPTNETFTVEIDGEVYIDGGYDVMVGDIVTVKVIQSDIYDLYAELV